MAESCGYGGCTFPKAILAMVRRKSVMVISVAKRCRREDSLRRVIVMVIGYGGCTFPKAILAMALRKSVMVVSVVKSCSKGGFPSVRDRDRLRRMHLTEGDQDDGVAPVSHGPPRW